MAEPDLKLWTVEEANATLPRVDALLADVRAAFEEHRFALEQIADLQRHHGAEPVRDESHPEHRAYARLLAAAAESHARLEATVDELHAIGIELKDPILGLVDFPALRGHEVVYLCWKQGEKEVAHWHSLTTGFPGRKPLDDLARAGGR